MTTEEFHRKLTAILSADVEGYSRLMEEDEDSTIRTLTSYRALMTSLIQKHRGRVVDSPGDNLLAEFGSVMDAVRCAVEIQEELRIRNSELAESRKMQFRIGINLGDVIEDGGRIYGDGINVAARVEGLADGGGICISGTVYDSIRNKLSMSYEFMGEHNVKNIKEPVRIYRIRMEPEAATKKVKEKKAGLRTWQRVALSILAIFILGAVAIWYFSFRQAPEVSVVEEPPVIVDVEETPKSIAVLPFDNLSSDPEQEYFVLGLSEEILNSLCQIPHLGVAGKTSSFSFKGKGKTIQEIASVLGVDHILEGSVRKAGNSLRITAQLIRASDGLHLWSETYDRELKDIFKIQEDIANSVADKLKLTLEAFNLVGGTDNVEAYELYLVAQGQGSESTYASIGRSLESIDAALALDPKFALAWASKASTHGGLAVFGPANRAVMEQDAGLLAAQKSIELEPNLAFGYYPLGFLKLQRGDFIEAELAFRKALELQTETFSGWEFYFAVHYDSVGFFKKAHDLLEGIHNNDPLNKTARAHYMLNFAFLGDSQRAEDEYKRGRALFERQWYLGDAFITGIRLGFSNVISSDLISPSLIKEHIDSPKEGLAELRRLYANNDNLSADEMTGIALCAAYFGDPVFAMDIIEKELKLNASGVFNVWYPVMREVRQLPRFKKFVKEIGLVDYWNKFGWPDICRELDNGDFVCD